MNVELIEDYYTNTLVYDKKHGDIIRLKSIGDDHTLQQHVMKKADVTVTFEQLRFYKQKFVVECVIEDVAELDQDTEPTFIQESSEEEFEEDIPAPNEDDIKKIKEECLVETDNHLVELKTELHKLEYKIQNIEKLKNELCGTFHIDDVIRICNDLEIICE